MAKRKEQKKKSEVKQGPEKRSTHTFTLTQKLTKYEYYRIKSTLYEQAKNLGEKGQIYREYKGIYRYRRYKDQGVQITLEHNENDKGYDRFFVRMQVNPRKLIDPSSSYLGILPPKKASIEKLERAFRELFEGTVFDNDMKRYYLSRIDLCTNIYCDSNRIFRELVRVLRKLPTPPKYERKKYKHKDRKKANRYNKHYIRLCCGTHELIIYDKTYQITEGNLVVAYENLPEGVLRIEVHCERAYINRVEKKYGTKDTLEVLWRMTKESGDRILKHFSQCFPNDSFMQISELEQCIQKSGFSEEKKSAMLALVLDLQKVQSVDKAVKRLKKKGCDTSDLLNGFAKLGISPIPLRKDFCAWALPGLVAILKGTSEGSMYVEYIRVKYK